MACFQPSDTFVRHINKVLPQRRILTGVLLSSAKQTCTHVLWSRTGHWPLANHDLKMSAGNALSKAQRVPSGYEAWLDLLFDCLTAGGSAMAAGDWHAP